jgi:TRAP-type uncharacterized transport system substrate-binding protein
MVRFIFAAAAAASLTAIAAFASSAVAQQPPRGPAATAAAPPAAPRAQLAGESPAVERMNEWTVGLAGGLLEGSFIRFAAEIAKVVDDPPNLRVLPVVSYGAVGNVSDLLYLKGIDVAITQADVLDHFKRDGKVGNVADRIHYIARMFVAEVHVYARAEIKTLADLRGKKVSFNTVGSAANLTGGIVFDRLGIAAERVFVNNSTALEKMRTGEIAAVVHVVAKPNELFTKYKPEPGFHFLPVEFTDTFKDYYLPVELTNEDYPNLIAKGERVESIGVSTVLAVFNWPKTSDRYRRLTRFIEQFVAKFEQFQQPPYQPKWREINLAATVPGWTRYAIAEEILSRAKPAAVAPVPAAAPVAAPVRAGAESDEREKFDQILAKWQRSGSTKSKLSEAEREQLFQEFRALNAAQVPKAR